jgi:hypothetical protein
METLNGQQQRIAALIASGGATPAQQIPADLTAPPGQPQYQRFDQGGFQQANPQDGNTKEILNFIKPFLTPEPVKTGTQALADRFFESMMNNAIDEMASGSRLLKALANRIIEKEARKEFGLPESDRSRVKHTVT